MSYFLFATPGISVENSPATNSGLRLSRFATSVASSTSKPLITPFSV
jgi:hypothetical protein